MQKIKLQHIPSASCCVRNGCATVATPAANYTDCDILVPLAAQARSAAACMTCSLLLLIVLPYLAAISAASLVVLWASLSTLISPNCCRKLRYYPTMCSMTFNVYCSTRLTLAQQRLIGHANSGIPHFHASTHLRVCLLQFE